MRRHQPYLDQSLPNEDFATRDYLDVPPQQPVPHLRPYKDCSLNPSVFVDILYKNTGVFVDTTVLDKAKYTKYYRTVSQSNSEASRLWIVRRKIAKTPCLSTSVCCIFKCRALEGEEDRRVRQVNPSHDRSLTQVSQFKHKLPGSDVLVSRLGTTNESQYSLCAVVDQLRQASGRSLCDLLQVHLSDGDGRQLPCRW